MTGKVTLEKLPTGVPGMDALLDGGISKYAFVVITGAPGSGKTTLAHQIMFSLATEQRRALFFTVMGEPPLKMLRYQQQYSFFDSSKIGSAIRYMNLADDLQTGGFDGVLERILNEIENFQPELIFVDSFKSVVQAGKSNAQGGFNLQYFVQRLGIHLATWQATTFLIGEYADAEAADNPIFTVADGIIHLCQDLNQNEVVRKTRIVKMRGVRHLTGMHSFRMGDDGIVVFPRLLGGSKNGHAISSKRTAPARRLLTGSPGLDEMLGGGIPAGYSIIVAGPPGCGKTVFATGFLREGARAGEHGIIASFESVLTGATNDSLQDLIDHGKVTAVMPGSSDLSMEELVYTLAEAVDRTGAKRVVIDSLSALELVLAHQYRADFLESLFRMLSNLHGKGVTIMMIRNVPDASNLGLTPSAFIVDGIIAMRYIEIDNKQVKMISVPKLRGSAHSDELRIYHARQDGIDVGAPL